MSRKSKLITIIITAVLLILTISFVGILVNSKKTADLEILVAPASSEIKIGNSTYKNGTHAFIPGTYPVEIKKDGFDTYTGEITIKEGGKNRLYHYLNQSDGSLTWYLNHKDDSMILGTIGEYEAEIKAKEYVKKDPILKVTPYYDEKNNHFQIVAEEKDNAIKVTANLNTCTDDLKTKYTTEVKTYLENQGINPANYDITYKGLCDN
ncbi:hypothetical protein IJH02_00835 [Candidatus Saccharibacteria bacterium]|nr:hypothetical protein [Candidatus Saccharibacteria bacterium]